MEKIDESRLKAILESLNGLSSFQWGLIKSQIDFVYSLKASKNTLEVAAEEHLLARMKRDFNLL